MFDKLLEKCLEKKFGDLFHISWKSLGSNPTLVPRIPSPGITVGEEDEVTPRVSLATTIVGCLKGIGPPYDEETGQEVDTKEFYVYKLVNNPKLYTPTLEQVPDVDISGEIWALEPARLKLVSKIKAIGELGSLHADIDYEILEEY